MKVFGYAPDEYARFRRGAAVQSFVHGSLIDTIGWRSVFASPAVLCALMALMGVLGRSRNALP